MKTETIYEDDDLIIINKPAGLLVIPDRFDSGLPCLKNILEARLAQPVFVVHRIDRDTSGVICFAKNEQTHKHLSLLFREHQVSKHYTGLVNGKVIPGEGRVEAAIAEHPAIKGRMTVSKKGKPSVTDYRAVQTWPLYSLVHYRIHTGRTHQIRVHSQFIGHSIVCDELYGDGNPFFLSSIKKKYRLSDKDEQERPLLNRLALHAHKLIFKKQDGTEIVAEAALPRDMAACVNQLNKWSDHSFLNNNRT